MNLKPAYVERPPQGPDRLGAGDIGERSYRLPTQKSVIEIGADDARVARQWATSSNEKFANSDRPVWLPDLASQIGSLRWFLELILLVGLCAAALSFWPSLSLSISDFYRPATEFQQEREFRNIALAPLGQPNRYRRELRASPLAIPLSKFPMRPSIEVTIRLNTGESLFEMLQRSGVSSVEAEKVAQAVGTAGVEDGVEPGWRSNFTLGARTQTDQARPLQTALIRTSLREAVSVVRSGPNFTASVQQISVTSEEVRLRGPVGSSTSNSMLVMGIAAPLQREYLAAIGGALGSRPPSIRLGDQFDMVVSIDRADDGVRKIGSLVFAGLDRGTMPIVSNLRWGANGQFISGLTHSSPVEPSMRLPVIGHITSSFGFRRHPLLGYFRMHSGVDIAAPTGTPIFAPISGRVARAGRRGGYGNYVALDHAGFVTTAFGHLSGIGVREGEFVQRGQVIGWVGASGLATGPHLHFEVLREGLPIDPVHALRSAFSPASPVADEREVTRQIAKYRSIIPSRRLPTDL